VEQDIYIMLLTVKRLNFGETRLPAQVLPVDLAQIRHKERVLSVRVRQARGVHYTIPEVHVRMSAEKGR
jgi:hypothetical protein